MKKLIAILAMLVLPLYSLAQPPEMKLTAGGFPPVSVTIPSTPVEKLLSLSEDWAQEYNRRQKGADISNVTANSMTITAFKPNAFNYGNKGEAFYHTIKYDMVLEFTQTAYTVKFNVTEIYHDDVLLEYKLPDYYTSEGKLKEGYNTLDDTLEDTVNDIIISHYNFLTNFR